MRDPRAAEGGDVTDKMCDRCKCCDLVTERCEYCEDGFDGHDCGEDCCACLHPEENVPCQICRGTGFIEQCLGGCNDEGKHPGKNWLR
jgi:hypothetical protein